MEKKDFKWYDAPQMEVVEIEAAVSLLAGSPGKDTGTGGVTSGDGTTPEEGD